MKWITAKDLENWAGTMPARTVFPALIADLIRASAPNIGAFRFPSGDKGEVRGFDGWLTSDGFPPYVPEGDSLWEFGITSESMSKATGDLDKRTQAVTAEVRARTTFVFVTPHTWDNPKKLLADQITEMSQGRGWKGVLFIDGPQLEDWLYSCPAVAAWYARQELNTAPQIGARSAEEFWDWYTNRFAPQLTEDVLLCGRQAEMETILKELVSGPSQIRFAADSPDEVIAFAIAAIRRSPNSLRIYLEARVLVVETEDAVRFLENRRNLIFMPRAQAVESSGQLASKGPTILAIGSNQARGDHRYLSRPSSYDFAKAIETMAFDETKALELARSAGRSLTILARHIPGGNAIDAEWASTAAEILPAILAGGWDSSKDADRLVVQALWNGARYGDIESVLRRFTRMQDPPIDREGHVWRIRAPVDAFITAGFLIGSDELDRLSAAATAVFSEIVEAPKADDLFIPDTGRSSKHSIWIKEGIATTILQIAVLGRRAQVDMPGIDPQRWVDDLIGGLPGLRDDGRLMASLRDQLPLLMEAAPSPLLSALEHLLEGDPHIGERLFWKHDSIFAPTSPHVYLLWALEALAWDPRNLSRVAKILTRLAELDSEASNRGNRPIGTLRSIFLSWNPNTNAPIDQRLAVIDEIISQNQKVGWQLLVTLSPRSHDSNMPTQKPRFRDDSLGKLEPLTNAVVWRSQAEIVERLLSLAIGDPDRILIVIENLYKFRQDHIEEALRIIENYMSAENSEKKLAVWTGLFQMARKHRSFAKSTWALSADVLARVDEVLERHQSQDPIERLFWLFNEWLPDMSGSPDDDESKTDSARRHAVQEIYGTHGRDGILRLVERVSLPHTVAEAVAVELAPDDATAGAYVVDASATGSDRSIQFASALSAISRRRSPVTWAKQLSALVRERQLGPALTAQMMLAWPDEAATWQSVAEYGSLVEKEYWLRKWPSSFRSGVDEALLGVQNYLKVGRATAALTSLYRVMEQIPSEILLGLLDAVFIELEQSDNAYNNMLSHNIELVLKELDSRSDVVYADIAKREYAFLPLLRDGDRPLAIHRLMASDPEFYVSLISSVFREEGQTDKGAALDEGASFSETQKARWRTNYQLLTEFHHIPEMESGGIDTNALRKWVSHVRQLGVDQKRGGVTDNYVGQIFAHAPMNEDGTWPHANIAQMIEEISSERLERGLAIEVFNKRGAYSKAIHEGGKQERELASRYRSWGEAARSAGLYRTAAMLAEIAKSWDADAEREDLRVRQDMLRS